jgi:hypothetical protein
MHITGRFSQQGLALIKLNTYSLSTISLILLSTDYFMSLEQGLQETMTNATVALDYNESKLRYVPMGASNIIATSVQYVIEYIHHV